MDAIIRRPVVNDANNLIIALSQVHESLMTVDPDCPWRRQYPDNDIRDTMTCAHGLVASSLQMCHELAKLEDGKRAKIAAVQDELDPGIQPRVPTPLTSQPVSTPKTKSRSKRRTCPWCKKRFSPNRNNKFCTTGCRLDWEVSKGYIRQYPPLV